MTNWLRSLTGYVSEQRKAWAAGNPARLKYEPGGFERLFQSASDSPVAWVSAVFALFLLGTLASGYAWSPPYPGLFDFRPTGDNYAPGPGFLGLWAVQAALVAVVYPIVVAFVTVLIQRQAASKASLQAYFASSGAKLTGLSSLMLVALMALQFVLLDSVSELTGFAWIVGDGVWFVANVALTVRFLVTTFQFASPEGRVAARNRYILTRAWPAEWAFHFKRLIAQDPVRHGLLSAPDAHADLDSEKPAFSARARHFASIPAVALQFRGEKRVVNIRYLFLGWAFFLWSRHLANRSLPKAPTGPTLFGTARKGPVLESGVAVEEGFSHREPIYLLSVQMGRHWLQFAFASLLRASVSLSSRRESRVTVLDALDEARLDAVTAIKQDSVADFEARLQELLDFYDQVIESSHVETDGNPDNWSLLPSSKRIYSDETVGAQWERSFTDLHSVAVSAIDQRADFVSRTVRVPARFFLRQSEYLCPQLKVRYLNLQYRHIRLVIDWAAERLRRPEAPDAVGSALEQPFAARYERVIKEAVGAWESLQEWRLGFDSSEKADWKALQAAASLHEQHILLSAQLVARSLRSGDRVATFWFSDSFLRWRARVGRRHVSEGVGYVDRYKVTVADLMLDFKQFRNKFPLAAYETESDETVRAAWRVALGNLWRDVGLLLVAAAVTRPGSSEPQRRLSASFVSSSLGTNLQDDSQSVADGPDRVVASLLRIFVLGTAQSGHYYAAMERVATALVPNAVSEGIAGRVYSTVGSELDSLTDGFAFVLARLAGPGWRISTQFNEAIRSWLSQDEVRQHLLDYFKSLSERVRSPELLDCLGELWALVQPAHPGTLPSQLALVADALDEFVQRVEHVREADIRAMAPHDEEVGRIAKQASHWDDELGKYAPLMFFESVNKLPNPDDRMRSRRLRMSGWDKGSLVRPRMAEPVSNEKDYLAGSVAQLIAAHAVLDLRTSPGVHTQATTSKDGLVEQLGLFSTTAIASGEKPLLLVNSRADPSWLSELRRPDEQGRVILDSSWKSAEGKPESYVGRIFDIEVYVASTRRGESILCTEATFKKLLVSASVHVTAEAEKNPFRCTLNLVWTQQAEFNTQRVICLRHGQVAPTAEEQAAG